MKNKGRIISIIFLAVLISAFIILAAGSGFKKAGNAYIESFLVADDNKITLNLETENENTHIIKVKVKEQRGGKLYLDCIYAFGGKEGDIDAKKEFSFYLDDDTEIIALYKNKNCYMTSLIKDKDGNWQFAKN